MKINKQRLQDNIWTVVFFTLLIALTVIIVYLINSFQDTDYEPEHIVGAVFINEINDGGWNQHHYECLLEACDELDASLIIRENVRENEKECAEAVKALVKNGCKIIFLTSDGFDERVRSVTSAYPDVTFYTISPQLDAQNVIMYYGRMYEARYAAGVLAGAMTKSNIIGYVAAINNPQVDRGINAFTIGARSVNPKAVVRVRFTGKWSDPNKEREAAQRLIDEDRADIITSHTSVPVAIDVAEDNQVFSIGYNCVERGIRSKYYLAGLTFHWDVLYKAMLRDAYRGANTNTGMYWWGVAEGVIDIEDFSEIVDDNLRNKLKKIRAAFSKGEAIFVGEIKRNDGRIMCESDERISDENLLYNMTWFVEGVEINED